MYMTKKEKKAIFEAMKQIREQTVTSRSYLTKRGNNPDFGNPSIEATQTLSPGGYQIKNKVRDQNRSDDYYVTDTYATPTKDISKTDLYVMDQLQAPRKGNAFYYSGEQGPSRRALTKKDVSGIRTAAGSGTLTDRLRTIVPGKGSKY